MKRSILLFALLVSGILMCAAGPASADGPAASRVSRWTMTAPRGEPPFSRSERSQSVWAAGACWSECGSHCAWGQSGCLERDAQGQCLKLTDICDRYCQRECRTSAGPLLPDFLDPYW